MTNTFINISGNSETNLIGKLFVQNTENNKYSTSPVNASDIKNILISNTHATDSVIIDLTIYDDSNNHLVLNNVTIPNGVSLSLDADQVAFDNNLYQMKIQLNAADSAVTIKIKH
tara:strand:+ start:338 stop:682 length:345 start_codon:yes stop_codon:yes gene_type:complete